MDLLIPILIVLVESSMINGQRPRKGTAPVMMLPSPGIPPEKLAQMEGRNVDSYTIPLTTESTGTTHTTPYRVSLDDDCDYLAYNCMRAYKTGEICARSMYYNYREFDNYCQMDYVNCMQRYIVWEIVHMGKCYYFKDLPITDVYDQTDAYNDLYLNVTYADM